MLFVYLFTYYWSVWQDKVLLIENIGKLTKGKGKSHVWWRASLPAKAKKQSNFSEVFERMAFMYVISNGSGRV